MSIAVLLFQYIDPGSMGVIAQFLYIALISVGAYFLLFFRGTRNLFNKLRGKQPPVSDSTGEQTTTSDETKPEK
jgi:hypothetical protein